MYWFPKTTKIQIKQDYCDGVLASNTTCTPYYYWTGTAFKEWLFFKWKKRFYDFKFHNFKLIFNKFIDVKIPIEIIYLKKEIIKTIYNMSK
jgi:hypothetical protein